MHFLLVFSIFALIIQSSLSVHPGDPFPTDRFKSKRPTSEDILNGNDVGDSVDDEVPSPSEPSAVSMDFILDENNAVDDFKSKSAKFPSVPIDSIKDIKIKLAFNKNLTSFTTQPVFVPKFQDNAVNQKNNLHETPSPPTQKMSTLLTTKPINKKNLIKIGRWKFEDLLTKNFRYWYETEAGRMGVGWTFDGYMFQAYDKSEPDTEPVYAFHSEIRSIWTNTIQMDPKPPVIGNDQWISDGVSFYAYPTSMNSTELQPVWRYWNKLKAGATDSTETRIAYLMMGEKDKNDGDRLEWIRDEILFYALPITNT